VEGQSLLFAETLELAPAESAALKENLETVRRLGFDLEEFGGTTWLLSGVPRVFAGQNCQQLLRDILEELASFGSTTQLQEKFDALLIRIACHGSVRGTWHLSTEEIRQLLERMDSTDFAANCPHGRPAIVRISRREIEKMFRRT
jgi:DNA mismatch repair protein MutL